MQMLDAVRALDEDPALLARLRERFRYILVDEFQDTNVAQLELLWRLAGERRQHRGRGRRRAGDLSLSRRLVRQLHDFPGEICGRGQGRFRERRAIRASAGGQLPLDRARAARGRAGDELPGTISAGAQERSGAAQEFGREGAHRRVGFRDGRGALDRGGNRTAARSGTALAEFRGAVPDSRAPRRAGDGAGRARDSVRDSQSFDPESPAGAGRDGLSATDRAAFATIWRARACWRLRRGAGRRRIWCG